MSDTKQKLTNDQLADMTPWDIARHLGIGYSGDMNPLEHGGFFYDHRDWDAWGYARCVEFWEDPDTGELVVQPGTIHRPDDMTSAFECCGISDIDDRNNVHCQIECCRDYYGIEPEGTAHPHLKVFRLESWKERNIWKSVRGWIDALGE